MASEIEGGCACGKVRYRLSARPMIVHGCHCRWCQRETGSALAINALVETNHVDTLTGDPRAHDLPSESGNGQTIWRCPQCGVALWSHYAALRTLLAFVRVGTLDDPDAFPPDLHIYTESKQPWLALPPDRPSFPGFYSRSATWPPDSLARYAALKTRAKATP